MQEWLFNIVKDFNRLVDDVRRARVQEELAGHSRRRAGRLRLLARTSGASTSVIAKAGEDVVQGHHRGLHRHRPRRSWARSSPCTTRSWAWSSSTTRPPDVAQKYRIPKIWQGDLTSPIGQSILNCDENGPMVMMVTNVVVDPAAGLVGTGRLFSGTISNGDAGLPAQLEEGGQDTVGPDIHGLPAGDRGLAPGGQHPGHPRARHPVGRDDIHGQGRRAVRVDPLRLASRS